MNDNDNYNEFGEQFVNLFIGIIKAVNMYSFNNDTTKKIFKRFHEFINQSINQFDSISFAYGSGNFFINAQLLELPFKTYKVAEALAKILSKITISEIKFLHEIPADELSTFFIDLVQHIKRGDKYLGDSLKNIIVKDFYVVEITDDKAETFDYVEYVLKIYGTALVNVEEIISKIRNNEPFDMLPLKKIFQNIIDNIDNVKYYLMAILNQNSFRTHLSTHLINTGMWAILFANRLNLDKINIMNLGLIGVFHDIGKIRIPEYILYKERKLTLEEEEEIKNIPYYSVDILKSYFDSSKEAQFTLLAIYENLLKSQEDSSKLTLFPRIVAVCDSYDSLTTKKPYRDAYLPEKALKLMLGEGQDVLDGRLVAIFMSMITFYPPGTTISLSTGEIAVVYSINPGEKDFFSPKVIPMLDPNFEFYDKKVVLDLSDSLQKKKRRIIETVDPFVYGLNPMFSFFNAEGVELD